jgi:hypothetical protein
MFAPKIRFSQAQVLVGQPEQQTLISNGGGFVFLALGWARYLFMPHGIMCLVGITLLAITSNSCSNT